MEGSPIHVVSIDGALRRALVARLERTPELQEHVTASPDFDCIKPGEIVISTPADCPPERAHELTGAGISVIILAAILRPEEHSRYERAGADAYVPMLIDGTDLIRAVKQSLERLRARTGPCRSA
jgi:CheY-like chemotaxis protein